MKGSVVAFYSIIFFACNNGKDNSVMINNFQLLIADTIGNIRAKWDHQSVFHCKEIAKQLNLQDLSKGADSIELRAWYSFSFSDFEELYVLKHQDSGWSFSFYRIFLRQRNHAQNDKQGNSFTQPVVDRFESKAIRIENNKWGKDASVINFDSIWLLPSQSQLKDSMGFTDCDTYRIEISNSDKYKFIRYHCPQGYIDLKNEVNNMTMLNQFSKIESIALKYNIYFNPDRRFLICR